MLCKRPKNQIKQLKILFKWVKNSLNVDLRPVNMDLRLGNVDLSLVNMKKIELNVF